MLKTRNVYNVINTISSITLYTLCVIKIWFLYKSFSLLLSRKSATTVRPCQIRCVDTHARNEFIRGNALAIVIIIVITTRRHNTHFRAIVRDKKNNYYRYYSHSAVLVNIWFRYFKFDFSFRRLPLIKCCSSHYDYSF